MRIQIDNRLADRLVQLLEVDLRTQLRGAQEAFLVVPDVKTAHGKGAVYWLEGSKRYGFRYPVSVEEILDVEPGKRLAYTVLRGIPVRNYRAEVTLTPSPDGTLIRWGASWDRTIMGRLVYRPLRNLYPVIVAGLVKAAEAPQS